MWTLKVNLFSSQVSFEPLAVAQPQFRTTEESLLLDSKSKKLIGSERLEERPEE